MTALLKTTQIQEPSSATVNITLDSAGGTSVNYIQGTVINGTSQASTSGTSVLFTGIPSWAKRVIILFNGMSTSGSSLPLIQVGAGSVTATGYSGAGQNVTTTPASANTAANTGWPMQGSSATNAYYGAVTLYLFGSNTWICSGSQVNSTSATSFVNGAITLGGSLDRVNITTTNGTDTFDAGSINIQYQG